MFNKVSRFFGGVIGKIEKLCTPPVEYWRKQGVTIGRHCRIAKASFGSEPYLVTLGDYVRITSGVHFLTHGGAWMLVYYRKTNAEFFGKIRVGNYVYFGNDVTVLPGVEIGDGCIVAACSVVARSVPPGCIVAGNPARIVGYTDDWCDRMLPYDTATLGLSPEEKRRRLLSLPDDCFIRKGFMREQ